VPVAIGAQGREVRRHAFDEAEGRLLGFYSAALAFTPVGAPTGAVAWTVDVGMEGTYVPWLSAARRRAGFDKPEATNLLPVFPRPRAALTLPQGLRLDVGWVPPVRAFGVKANVLSLALARTTPITRSLALTPRLAALTGYVRAAVTCYDELAGGDDSQQVYFAFVCHAHESDDRFAPRHLAGELIATYGRDAWPVVPYAGAGARAERARFDIGVILDDGSRSQDDPILEMRAVRGYGFAGATWSRGAARLSGELYYAPGSMLTGRVLASFRVRER
jgi:hypothetical protein